MRIVVIGAGVVGVTTAYSLAREGHSVTVVEREPSTAMESSFANGGQLSFGFASPMATPDLLGKAAAIVYGRDPAFRLPLRFLLRQPGWMLRFARACLAGSHRRNARLLASLADASRDALDRLCEETGVNFDRRKAGKLMIYSTHEALEEASKEFRDRSAEVATLGRQDCIELDAALSGISGPFAGGLWFGSDEVGDAELFCRNVADKCRSLYGVRFRFNLNVDDAQPAVNRPLRLTLSDGESHECDAVVVCTGAAGQRLLRQLNIRLPIVPVTGYSITAPLGSRPPAVAITDADRKVVCSRIGDYVRIAGFADFGHPDDEVRRERIQALIRLARQRFPDAADFDNLRSTWSGVRPATPNSLPIVGATRVPGVYLNMGHGMYGWTLAPATADQLAAAIGVQPGHLNAA